MRARFFTIVVLVLAGVSCAPSTPPDAASPARTSAEATQPSKYNREDWRHWIDADGDCQDTRTEVLIAESEVPVTYKDSRQCKVATGRWTCPYTGRVFTAPGGLDIDHMVPLKNAHLSGGAAWTSEKKKSYANDLEHAEHLVAVDGPTNREKSDRGPEEWLPPNEDYRCQYILDWKTIKKRWHMTMNAEEKKTVDAMLRECGL